MYLFGRGVGWDQGSITASQKLLPLRGTPFLHGPPGSLSLSSDLYQIPHFVLNRLRYNLESSVH